MPSDLTFLDLVVLEKIQGDTVMDTFSGMIGTSFFETAEVMGKMKTKGIIDIVPTIGKSILKRTPLGDSVLKQAETRIAEPLDELDYALIRTIASGVTEFDRTQEQMNIRSEDLSYRVYKVTKQGYIDYIVKNAKTFFSLTESGFKIVGPVPKATTQTQLTSIAGAPASKKEPSPKAGVELVMGAEDATKHLPPSKEPVDIKKKQAELQMFRKLKILAVVLVLCAIAYFGARYLGLI